MPSQDRASRDSAELLTCEFENEEKYIWIAMDSHDDTK